MDRDRTPEMKKTPEITAPVTALDPVLDDEDIPDFLKRPFPNEGRMTDGVVTGEGGSQQPCQPTASPAELSPNEEFRAKNPYTPRDLEVIAQLTKEQEQSSKTTKEAEKAAKQSKRDAEKAEQERLRQIRINLRRQQGVPKQEWDE